MRARICAAVVVFVTIVSYSNCSSSRNSASVVSTGNPYSGTSLDSVKILDAVCSLLVSCTSTLTLPDCQNGINGTSGVAQSLGAPPIYPIYSALVSAESSGAIIGNNGATGVCVSSVANQQCQSSIVQSAYNGQSPTPFAGVAQLLNQSASCPATFIASILVGGTFNGNSFLHEINNDGTLDANFNGEGSGPNGAVQTTLEDTNGRAYILGNFSSYSGQTLFSGFARINQDGSLDSTFAPNSNPTIISLDLYNKVYGVQTDGGIEYISRLTNSGTIDASFSGAQANYSNGETFSQLTIDPNNKIFAVHTYSGNGSIWSSVDRFLYSGSPDTGFLMPDNQAGKGLQGNVKALITDSSARVLAGGDFINYDGTSVPNISRFNSDGSFDSSFTQCIQMAKITGSARVPVVESMALDSNGDIILGGYFKISPTGGGQSLTYLARLLPTGCLDTSFIPAPSVNLEIYSVMIDSLNRIYVSGAFGQTSAAVVRLNLDGSIDSTFSTSVLGLANSLAITQ